MKPRHWAALRQEGRRAWPGTTGHPGSATGPGSGSHSPGMMQFTPPARKARRGVPVLPPASCWERVPWQKDKLPSHGKHAAVTHPTARGTPKGSTEPQGKREKGVAMVRKSGGITLQVLQASTGPSTSLPCPQARDRQLPGGSRVEAEAKPKNRAPNPSNLLTQ